MRGKTQHTKGSRGFTVDRKLGRGEAALGRVSIARLTLRFGDRQLESAFRAHYFRDNLANFRFTMLGGVLLWALAVAGAPLRVEDHAGKAAEMALDILEESSCLRWPSGDPIVMRIGLACGPAVAGVIGDRKIAYDLGVTR